jgi:hypothetical protein
MSDAEMSMIEKVARELSIADGNHPDACSNDEDETPVWTLYVEDAKAAIYGYARAYRAALKETTNG